LHLILATVLGPDGKDGGVMELAHNLELQNKKQPPEACVVLIAVGCEDLYQAGPYIAVISKSKS
jgi:hypothetical protein